VRETRTAISPKRRLKRTRRSAHSRSAIAGAAAQLVQDGESIIINGGPTIYALVDFLTSRPLDILTNSLAIVIRLLGTSRIRISMPAVPLIRNKPSFSAYRSGADEVAETGGSASCLAAPAAFSDGRRATRAHRHAH
jgi:DeoR/GlpR family transcriptional regulator of sugar metabolism